MTDNISDDMGGGEEMQLAVPSTKRDELGFITSTQPNLSASQVQFILALATVHDTVQAADLIGVPIADVLRWFDDEGFTSVYHSLLGNKREGVKQIGSQLLPMMLLQLTQILNTGNNKERLTAVKLLSQMQGLLLTQGATVDKGAIEALREELIRQRPTQSYRIINAKNTADNRS